MSRIDLASVMDFSRRALFGVGLAAAAAASPRAGLAGAIPGSELGIAPGEGDRSKAFSEALDRAAERGVPLFLPGGRYVLGNIRIVRPVSILGVPGETRIVHAGGESLFEIGEVRGVRLDGLAFDGLGRPIGEGGRGGLVVARGTQDLAIERCAFLDSAASGIVLDGCSGAVIGSTVGRAANSAIFSLDAKGLEISHNRVHDCGNNGILVWQSEKREDGTLVSHNRIERIAANHGGSGQNGNGINLFRAGNVIVSNNRIADCAFSAVRCNSASHAQIIANNCSRSGEVALYAEFAFEGAVISGNIVERAQVGVSVTNFDHEGRLAVVSGNLIREILPRAGHAEERGIGIFVEADTAVTGNVIDSVAGDGIALGWAWALRDVSAVANTLRNCEVGITASVAQGARRAFITGNLISGSRKAAILGRDRRLVVTGDLAVAGAVVPANLSIAGNLVA